MLDAGRAVVLEVLVDLALSASGSRLVDREHDATVVPHHGGCQRRILGMDGVRVEMGETVEAEDTLVVADPVIEGALPDVRNDVVEALEPDRTVAICARCDVAGQEDTRVVATVDEGMERVAIDTDRRLCDGTVRVVFGDRRLGGARATRNDGSERALGVIDRERRRRAAAHVPRSRNRRATPP